MRLATGEVRDTEPKFDFFDPPPQLFPPTNDPEKTTLLKPSRLSASVAWGHTAKGRVALRTRLSFSGQVKWEPLIKSASTETELGIEKGLKYQVFFEGAFRKRVTRRYKLCIHSFILWGAGFTI